MPLTRLVALRLVRPEPLPIKPFPKPVASVITLLEKVVVSDVFEMDNTAVDVVWSSIFHEDEDTKLSQVKVPAK